MKPVGAIQPLSRRDLSNGAAGAHWTLYECVGTVHTPNSPLVQQLTDDLMVVRTMGVRWVLDAWRRVTSGGTPYSADEDKVVRAFIKPSLGLPTPTERQPAHLVQAAVAEHLWFWLMRQDTLDPPVHIEPPKLYVNSPGPDGMSVHRRGNALSFRLWEVKKHTAANPIARTLADAYKQLETQALQYLAQYSAASITFTGDLASLYSELVDAWRLGADSAGVGVSVTSRVTPKAAFRAMPKYFQHLHASDCRRGQCVAIADFPDFVDHFLTVLWTGL